VSTLLEELSPLANEAISRTRRMTPDELKRAHRSERPPFVFAVVIDIDAFCANRGEPKPTTKLGRILAAVRLCWQTDAFLGLLLYRVRMALSAAGIPILPRLLHHLSIRVADISIGDWTVMEEGIYIPHGHIIIDGLVKIGPRCELCPWVTLGRQPGSVEGPTLAECVYVGTGAKILGDVKIGAHARIGANAVVLHDVPAGTTAVGAPARIIEGKTTHVWPTIPWTKR
jgi:serine O-acetyltransferase